MGNIMNFTDKQLIDELTKRREGSLENGTKKYQELEEELRHLSSKLREAEQGKSDFLSNVRNEMNNPLTSILGLSKSISGLTHDEKVIQLSRLIHLEAFELDYQIRNIIAAAEIESGEIKLLPTRVDIVSLIENQISYLQPRSHTSHISIDHQTSRPKLLFNTDAYLFQTIITNLLANAVEFSKKEAEVIIKAWMEDDKLFVEVSDSGIGIEPEMQKRIFERFLQLDNGSTKLHRGQGLGLAIVTEFVSLLDGGIKFNSQTEQGTTVTLQIPKLDSESVTTDSSSFGNEILFNEVEEF
jgi:signal transduction histidine kinase